MMSSPVSQLRPWVQRTIDAINLPFLLIEYAFTPIVNGLRRSCCLTRRICKQNWIFLCIFYLHLWQSFKSSAPIRPFARHWTHITSSLLFMSCATLATLILCASIPLFATAWSASKDEYYTIRLRILALFIFTCAPACAVLSTAFSAAYYLYKRHQHGVHLANMRKLGNGYWADPRDFEDWRKARGRTEAIERLKAWDEVEAKTSFIVDRVCDGCGAVKEGLSPRCEKCGEFSEEVVRRTWGEGL